MVGDVRGMPTNSGSWITFEYSPGANARIRATCWSSSGEAMGAGPGLVRRWQSLRQMWLDAKNCGIAVQVFDAVWPYPYCDMQGRHAASVMQVRTLVGDSRVYFPLWPGGPGRPRHDREIEIMSKLLEVRNLETMFYTVDGVVRAVNGISYTVDQGECLAIVGESGSGKTVGVLSILRLIPTPPGRIIGGSVLFKGIDLLSLDERELRAIRGGAISVVFQDPMTSLNPVMRIGAQITESIMAHERLTAAPGAGEGGRSPGDGRDPRAGKPP